MRNDMAEKKSSATNDIISVGQIEVGDVVLAIVSRDYGKEVATLTEVLGIKNTRRGTRTDAEGNEEEIYKTYVVTQLGDVDPDNVYGHWKPFAGLKTINHIS